MALFIQVCMCKYVYFKKEWYFEYLHVLPSIQFGTDREHIIGFKARRLHTIHNLRKVQKVQHGTFNSSCYIIRRPTMFPFDV